MTAGCHPFRWKQNCPVFWNREVLLSEAVFIGTYLFEQFFAGQADKADKSGAQQEHGSRFGDSPLRWLV